MVRKKRIIGIVVALIGISLFLILSSYAKLCGVCFCVIGVIIFTREKAIVKQPPSDIAIQLKEQLPPSVTPLSSKNVKKIHQLFPVPNDYDILWAEVYSFGKHPAGVVITNEALILKAPKSEIKKQNKEIKKQNKGKEKKDKQTEISYIYRIIPWQYFSPDDYSFISNGKDEKKQSYQIVLDESTVFHFETPELFEAFQSLRQSYLETQHSLENLEVATVNAAINTISTQQTIYMAKNGSANTSTGHGIIAEDVGTVLEKMRGTDATVVGRDNAVNGPDKLVRIDGVQTAIQCKYCNSASNSVNACFGKDGLFRYYDLNGNPMKIEVPKDQYLKAIEAMKTKIQSGKVPGVTNPEKAFDIIRKGSITYEQAKNLARAGTFESITYDVATASVRCLSAFGISFLFAFAQVYWETKDIKQATKSALVTSAKIYGLAIFGSVISSQFARAGIENLFYPMMKNLVDALPNSLVERMASTTRGFVNTSIASVEVTGSYYARFLAAQASASCIMFLVFSAPDIYKVISNNISAGQFAMNMAERFAGMAAGTIVGSGVGSLVGKAVNPLVGGFAGLAAGTVGGMSVSFVTRKFVHLVREDDSVIVSRLFTAVLINTAMDYMLSQSEQSCLIKLLEQDKKGLERLQKKLLKRKNQAHLIRKYLVVKIETVIKERKQIKELDEQSIKKDADEIVVKGELCYEV